MTENLDAMAEARIHLLDVGRDEYGDAILCQFGKRFVLIDGAHPGDHDGTPGHSSIPEQIEALTGSAQPYPIDLVIITHAHQDHIGCLPRLISDGIIKVGSFLAIDPRLGWGRSGDTDALLDNANLEALKLTAALREELRSERGTRDSVLDQFLTDAVNLETTYKKMFEKLEQDGTRVFRFGNPQTDPKQLETEFAEINLKILGPSNGHLLECAEQIAEKTSDAVKFFDSAFNEDAQLTGVDVYRRAAKMFAGNENASDSIDAGSRPGPYINLQSIITQFEFAGHKFLFAGDFQFADPQTKNEAILSGVRELKAKIKSEAPYSFVKLSHHGSGNAFSAEMLADLGKTRFFGLCAGEESTHHPAAEILKLLEDHQSEIKWARTDHNGLVTLIYKKDTPEPEIKVQKGILNDAKPNFVDQAPSITPITATASLASGSESETPLKAPSRPVPGEPPAGQSKAKSTTASDKDYVEITARIPFQKAAVKFSGEFTIEIEPDNRAGDEKKTLAAAEPNDSDPGFAIGGGRDTMRSLFFLTSAEKLAENIGLHETKRILEAFEKQEIPFYADLPAGLRRSAEATDIVRAKLADYPDAKGVVIVGGYDVVPAQILDCLPPALRSVLPPNDDPDNFIVWSDAIYGDRNGDGLPEIPVSRIPDGRSARLVHSSLQSSRSQNVESKFGIRNIARPFAVDIFEKIPGNNHLLTSGTMVFDQIPAWNAAQAYFMLHGDYRDSSRFWGEETPLNREAFHVYNLPESFQGVVFAGCCWGALTVDTPAGRIYANRPFSLNTVESSVALSFLERGANAFVGCTGAHYSPTEPPFNYFGGPMHTAFWQFYNSGLAPAESLFNAKLDYLNRMPHGRTSIIQQAIEYKILRQFTCLGLGW